MRACEVEQGVARMEATEHDMKRLWEAFVRYIEEGRGVVQEKSRYATWGQSQGQWGVGAG